MKNLSTGARLFIIVLLVTWFSLFVGSVIHETVHSVEAESKGQTVREVCYIGFSSEVFPQYWPPSRYLWRFGLGWIEFSSPRIVAVSELSEARGYTIGYGVAVFIWVLLMSFLFPLRESEYWGALFDKT